MQIQNIQIIPTKIKRAAIQLKFCQHSSQLFQVRTCPTSVIVKELKIKRGRGEG